MRHPVRTAAIAATALLVAACASTGQGADPADLAGCYYFDRDDVARDLQLPWGVRLLDRPLPAQQWPALQQYDGVRVATTLTGDTEESHPFGYWRPLAGDSILVGYPAGGGISVRVARADGALAGSARALGDATAARDRPTRPVRLVHARCPEDL